MEIDLTAFLRTHQQTRTEDVSFLVPAGPTQLGAQVRLAKPASVAVCLAGNRGMVRVEVSADLHLCCPCDRCLDEVRFEMPVAFTEEWRLGRAALDGRGRQHSGVHAQAWDAESDDDAEMVVRRTVCEQAADLDEAFWQNAGLALPLKVLCAENCRGLCQRCGTNLNRTVCMCSEAPPDSRLSLLGRWRPDPHR